MKVLVVSDTHGRDEKLEAAVQKEAPVDLLVHCGDVEGREFFVEALAECPAALYREIMIFSQIFQERKK